MVGIKLLRRYATGANGNKAIDIMLCARTYRLNIELACKYF